MRMRHRTRREHLRHHLLPCGPSVRVWTVQTGDTDDHDDSRANNHDHDNRRSDHDHDDISANNNHDACADDYDHNYSCTNNHDDSGTNDHNS